MRGLNFPLKILNLDITDYLESEVLHKLQTRAQKPQLYPPQVNWIFDLELPCFKPNLLLFTLPNVQTFGWKPILVSVTCSPLGLE